MAPERGVDEGPEGFPVFGQEAGTLGEAHAHRTVAAIVGRVAARLVGEEVDVQRWASAVAKRWASATLAARIGATVRRVLQKVDNIAVIGHGDRPPFGDSPSSQPESLFHRIGDTGNPALTEASVDARTIHLGDDRCGAGDDGGLALSPRHPSQARGDEEFARQVAVAGDAQLEPACVHQGIECAMHDTLRADVHPSAGRHLPVVGDPQGGRQVEVLLVVEHAYHEAIGDDDAGRQGMAGENAERMARFHHQSAILVEDLQIVADQSVLHPVLADLARLAVGDEFVGVEGHVEVKIVVNHDAESPSLDAAPRIFVDRKALEPPGGPEAIPVDPAPLPQFSQKFGRKGFMPPRRDVPQGIAQREALLSGA